MDNQNDFDTMDSFIELVDEEGNSAMFEHIATVEHEGEVYLMVAEESSFEDAQDDEEVEAIILKVEQDENGEDNYVTLEDDELAAVVFEKCLEVLQEEQENEDE